MLQRGRLKRFPFLNLNIVGKNNYRELVNNLKRNGFALIKVSEKEIDYNGHARWFDELPIAVKEEVKMTENYPFGWEKDESLDKVSVDKKQTYTVHLGREKEQELVKWPESIESKANEKFKKDFTSIFEEGEYMCDKILEEIAVSEGFERNHFKDKMDKNFSSLRMLMYKGTGEAELKAGEHTDYGLITVIIFSDEMGLQLWLNEEQIKIEIEENRIYLDDIRENTDRKVIKQVIAESGGWFNVDVPANVAVVNNADLLEIWSNGDYMSTWHRVVAEKDRVSYAFFCNPNLESKWEPHLRTIWPAKFRSVVGGEYIMGRHQGAMKSEFYINRDE